MLEITPQTKIWDLLESYPFLEHKLIAIAPAFRKIKNPVLKKTVARITSLQQAAIIVDLPVDRLVNSLREEAGQGEIAVEGNMNYQVCTDDDIKSFNMTESIDIRSILQAGQHPAGEVLKLAGSININETLLVICPFIPAPLIDQLATRNYNCKIREVRKDLYQVYFTKMH